MTMGGGGGISSTHSSALKLDWSLRYGSPSSLRVGRHQSTCHAFSRPASMLHCPGNIAQSLSGLAWAQVALASDYTRRAVMRTLNKSDSGHSVIQFIPCALTCIPHSILPDQQTMKLSMEGFLSCLP